MHTSQRIMPWASRQAPRTQGGSGGGSCSVHCARQNRNTFHAVLPLCVLLGHPPNPSQHISFLTAAIVCAPRIFNKLCKNVRGFRAFPSSSFGSSSSSVLLAVLFKFACIFYLLNKQNFTQRSSQKKRTKERNEIYFNKRNAAAGLSNPLARAASDPRAIAAEAGITCLCL